MHTRARLTCSPHSSPAGLLQHYDAHLSLPLLAPRPLLIANGELDPRCPLEASVWAPVNPACHLPAPMPAEDSPRAASGTNEPPSRLVPPACLQGVEAALVAAREAYAAAGAADKLQLYIEPGVGHECTNGMWQRSMAFFDAHLRPDS